MNEGLRVDDNIIKGCQSKVWLTHTFVDDKLLFLGDSNTAITKGLLSLLINIFNNRSPKEILDSKLFFINETGLCRFIGTQRSNGLEAMENKFKLIALNALKNG
jgi:cysteine desulfuration protein SufE